VTSTVQPSPCFQQKEEAMTDPTLGITIGDLKRAVDQEAARVNFLTWTNYDRIAGVVGEQKESISRQGLRDLANSTWAPGTTPDQTSIERVFVLTMMWGSGTTNGRGPRYTDLALSSGQVADVLSEARNLLADGGIPGAYDLHKRLPGVGPAFFTKLLWVLGQTVNVSPTPLVMDSLVWKSLGQLGWNRQTAAGGSRRSGDQYLAYLSACEIWAGEHASPEDVEYTLFERGRHA